MCVTMGLSSISGCSESRPADEIVPDLPARPSTAYCLASTDTSLPASEITLPDMLSETGCFEDLVTLAPAPDLIPYRINSPLWTDGLHKERFLVLPPGQTVGFTETGAWDFPVGSVLIKGFVLEAEVGNAQSRRSLETRFMVRGTDGWEFYSYKWNESGADAVLFEGPLTEAHEVRNGDSTTRIFYEYPSHDGCVTCHAEVAGIVLGPRTMQLSSEVNYEGGRQNQLAALAAIGLFREPLPRAPEDMFAMVSPADENASLELRARSYLHGNCSHCHQPGGWSSTLINIDLRYELTLEETRICGVPVQHRIHIDDGEYVIDPGNPDNSNIYGRMTGDGTSKMPPLGRSVPDPLGSEVVRAWIESLTECP